MITDLKVTFRHLQKTWLNNLSGVNIIVGPNNAGKTSIFRAVQSSASEREQPRIEIGTTLASIENGPEIFRRAGWAPGARLTFWSTSHRQPNRADRGIWNDGGYSALLVDRAILEKSSPRADWKEGPKRAEETLVTLTNSLIAEHAEWSSSLYFLWHRRKSRYQEELGSYRDRLDEEAEYLAGRLDHIQAGTGGMAARRKIDQFMAAVVPGLGEIGIRRSPGENQRTMISIIFSNGERTLDELGGGVEQVLALAMVLIGEKDSGAVFIEEPESHLHESAQRRLIEQILLHRGSRQLFIATHSPVFVNGLPGANIYRVTRASDGQASIYPCLDHQEKRRTLDELGVLPSTLIQTNAVIWVEGPTEARLVRHWLGLLAPELKLHQHYEFAETGGSNIVQLGADLGEDDSKLRDIMKICRNNFVVCDLDAPIGAKPSKTPVKEIQKMFGESHWITFGYEIEWYYPREVIEKLWGAAVADHVEARTDAGVPFYQHLAASGARGTKSAEDRKVLYAERAVALGLDANIWFAGDRGEHLREHVQKVANFIRTANQIAESSPGTCAMCHQPLSSR